MTSVALNEVDGATVAASATSADEGDMNMVFCLEFFVQHVTNLSIGMQKPAIAFRLLDFPLIIIHAPEANSEAKPSVSREVDFHKGKSALFQLSRNVFQDLLVRVPLSVMLLDLELKEASKLAGSAAIDLSPLRREILVPLQSSPSGYQRGIFPLVDLMSNRVANVAVVLRLCCLGSALLPHLRTMPLLTRAKKQIVADTTRSAASNQPPISSHNLSALDTRVAYLQPLPRDETATAFRRREQDQRRQESNARFLAEEKQQEAMHDGTVPYPSEQLHGQPVPQTYDNQQYYYDPQTQQYYYKQEQHPAAASYELDQYAATAAASQYEQPVQDVFDTSKLSSHKAQLSLGTSHPATSSLSTSSKRSRDRYASVPEIEAAIAKELEQHNLRVRATDPSNPYSARSVEAQHPLATQGTIIPQADDYAPPALFFYKGSEEAVQSDLLSVEYHRCINEARAQQIQLQQIAGNSQSHPPQLEFYSKEAENRRVQQYQDEITASRKPHHSGSNSNEYVEKPRTLYENQHQMDLQQKLLSNAQLQPQQHPKSPRSSTARTPLSPRSPRTSQVHPTSAPVAAAAPPPAAAARVIDPTTPQRHQLRHRAPAPGTGIASGATSAHGRKLSALEMKYRAMEAEIAAENSKGGGKSLIPASAKIAEPRLSVEERGRLKVAPKPHVLQAADDARTQKGMLFDMSGEGKPKGFPELPPTEPGKLPVDIYLHRKASPASTKKKATLKKGTPSSVKKRPATATAAASAVKSKPSSKPPSHPGSASVIPQTLAKKRTSNTPFAAAFEKLQIEHEALQPSPAAAPRPASLHSATEGGEPSARRRVQFEARVPEPPSPESVDSIHSSDERRAARFSRQPSQSSLAPASSTSAADDVHFDSLLQEVESQLAARAEARRSAPPAGEYLSPMSQLRHAALPELAAPSYPVTESQLARVALDFLNANPTSRGMMSQYLLQQQLQGIATMITQPQDVIHRSLYEMNQRAQAQAQPSAASAFNSAPVDWNQYDLNF